MALICVGSVNLLTPCMEELNPRQTLVHYSTCAGIFLCLFLMLWVNFPTWVATLFVTILVLLWYLAGVSPEVYRQRVSKL